MSWVFIGGVFTGVKNLIGEQWPKVWLVNGLFKEYMQLDELKRNGCDIMEDKIGKVERLITLLQLSRFSSPIQFLCCSKSNLKKCKSDSLHTHTHKHTHRVPLGKIASYWAKQMNCFIIWPLLISSMNSLPATQLLLPINEPQKQGHCIFYFLNL